MKKTIRLSTFFCCAIFCTKVTNLVAYRADTIEKTDLTSLQQGGTADCGFYALFATLNLKQNTSLKNRKLFDKNIGALKKHTKEKWGRDTWIGSDDIESLVDEFTVFAPLKKPGAQPLGDSFTDSIFTDDVVLIQNIYDIEYILEQIKTKKIDPNDFFALELKNSRIWKCIENFHNGKPQTIITNLTSRPGDQGSHWFALRLSWKNKKTLRCECANSCSGKLSHKAVVAKICKLFAQKR